MAPVEVGGRGQQQRRAQHTRLHSGLNHLTKIQISHRHYEDLSEQEDELRHPVNHHHPQQVPQQQPLGRPGRRTETGSLQ